MKNNKYSITSLTLALELCYIIDLDKYYTYYNIT